jgi:response regulator RpfG family c-di-GMP phosphodiesterase
LPVHLVTTPDQLSRAAASGMNSPDRNSKPTTIKTVLILDGDVLVRMPVVEYLRECGCRVIEAATTDEAIAILQKTNIPVDVVLSDIDIPGSMNGFGLRAMGSLNPPRIEDTARRNPRAYCAECGGAG